MEEDKKEQNTEKNAEKEKSAQEKEKNISPISGDEKQNANEKIEDDNTQAEEQNDIKKEDENIEDADSSSEKGTETKMIYPNVIPGANVKIHQKIKEKKGKEEKERIQIFEGIVLARKGGSSAGATISVKKICKGGFEVKKIYPLHSPAIAKIDVVRQAKVRRAKLGFLKKDYKKKLKYKNQ